MILGILALAVTAVAPTLAQTPNDRSGGVINLPGTLELVDKPPEATPVEAFGVAIYGLQDKRRYSASTDRNGNFTLEDLPPGRYSLSLSFPGRIQVFTCASRSILPDDFELREGERGPLRIVVSLKTADVAVEITGIPEDRKEMVALLSPADPYLTLRESSMMNKVFGNRTRFRFIVPGRYTLLVMDSEFQSAIAFSAAVREALKKKATVVQVPDGGETSVEAVYVPASEVERAIREAGARK